MMNNQIPLSPVPSRPAPPARRSGSPPLLALFLAGVTLLVFLLPLIVILGSYLYFEIFGLILPGVVVGDVSVDGVSTPRAAARLDQAWNGQRQLILSDGARSWAVSPAEVGLWLDPNATAQQAFEVGREQGLVAVLFQIWRAPEEPVAPVVLHFPDVARHRFESLVPQVNIPPQEAVIRFIDGKWTAIPGRSGFALEMGQVLDALAADPALVMLSGRINLPLVPVAPQVADRSGEVARLESLLANPLHISAFDPVTDETIVWAVPQDLLAGWVRFEQGAIPAAFTLDEQAFERYLLDWQSTLGASRELQALSGLDQLAPAWRSGQPYNVLIRHRPTTYTVQPGDRLITLAWKVGMPYWKILEANPGIDADRLVTGQVLTIPSKNEMLPLPVVRGKRIVISITEQRLWTYVNGEQRSKHLISTGIDRSPTQPGMFQVLTHERSAYASVWELTMPHFLGIYESWPGFMNGIHGLPTLSNGRRLWANVLGRPASYGCIILNLQEAEDLYRWAENGVVVEIRP